MTTFDELLLQLDSSNPVRRGRQFESLCEWWLRNDPTYRMKLRHVWTWDDWPGRDGPDTGIDLVAETRDGDHWAIQCKGYGDTSTVTKRHVDAFLAESARPPFTYRLLIASTESLSANARRTIDRQERGVGVVLRSDLSASSVEWPTHLEALLPSPPSPAIPRPYQAAAIDAVVEGLKIGDRGRLHMACGTGKTLVGMWVHERLRARRTLVLVPSLSLLSQTLREWAANSSMPFYFQAVCSDESVADKMVSSTSSLGVPTTTSPDEIASFLDGDGVRVMFATYQSSERVSQAVAAAGAAFDLVIADEAHRTAGRNVGHFATVLDSERLPAQRRVFMTATPRYYTRRIRRTAEDEGITVASMDDETMYGPVLYRLGFAEAVEADLLSPYRLVIVGVTDAQYKHWIGQRRLVTTDGENVTDARSLAGQVGLAKAMAEYDLRRVITFHNRVLAAQRFAAELPETIGWMPPASRPSGPTWSDYVSGSMSSGARHAKLRQLADPLGADRAVLSNAQCLSEGVDVPALDGVAFVEPRRSQVDIIQAVGRVMRKAPGKQVGTIVLPVFIDAETDDIESAVESTDFQPIFSMVAAIRAHDERLGEELDQLRRELGRTSRTSVELPSQIVLDLPADVSPAFSEALTLRVLEEATASFEEWLGLLERFSDVEGHATPRVDYVTDDDRQLGRWVASQRVLRTQGLLSAERVAALDRVPGWTWDVQDNQWQEGLARLRTYIAQNGHIPDQSFVTEDGFLLGRWIQSRRTQYSRGRLALDRVESLEALPGWSWSPRADMWWARYGSYLVFMTTHDGSHPRSSSSADEHERSLAHWAAAQRRRYRQGSLEPRQEAALLRLPGWQWRVRKGKQGPQSQETLEDWFALLERYAAEHDHARPSQHETFEERRLGSWVSQVRLRYRKGDLPQEFADRLSRLPGWVWSVQEANWEDKFGRLRNYVDRFGSADLPKGTTDESGEVDLYIWVRNQRWDRSQGRLSQEREARLEELPGWRWPTPRRATKHRRDS